MQITKLSDSYSSILVIQQNCGHYPGLAPPRGGAIFVNMAELCEDCRSRRRLRELLVSSQTVSGS